MSDNTIIPRPLPQMFQWVRDRADGWVAHAVAIGITVPQANAIKTALSTAQAKADEASQAKVASKNATIGQNSAATELRALAQQAVDRVRVFAQSSSDPSAVYELASVPPPEPPTPLPAPEPPVEVNADPNADGTVLVSWKGSQVGGAFFTVWRKVGASGAWSQAGAIAAKKFMDFDVPNPGLTEGATLFYGVRTQRNVEVSAMSVPATITYGAGPGFAAFAGNTMGQSGKMAA